MHRISLRALATSLPTLVTTALLTPAAAQTLRVPQQFATIRAALAAATSGATILVEPGTYNESNLDFRGRRIVLRSVGGAAVTILDGPTSEPFLFARQGEPRGTAVIGFTFRNSTGLSGGGIVMSNLFRRFPPANLEIRDCVFEQTEVGVFVSGSNAEIRNCTFRDNLASGVPAAILVDQLFGGGKASALIEGCRFFRNRGTNATGGAIAVFDDSDAVIRSCSLHDNSAPGGSGGAVYVEGILATPSVTIENCTITANADTALRVLGSSRVRVRNSIVWQNPGTPIQAAAGTLEIEWSNVEGGFPGIGNIAVDPQFVDPAQGDYRLQPSSPMVDAGDPARLVPGRDAYGDPRTIDGYGIGGLRTDLGADEVAPLSLSVAGTPTPNGTIQLTPTSIGPAFASVLIVAPLEADQIVPGVAQLLVGGALFAEPIGAGSVALTIPADVPLDTTVFFQLFGIAPVAWYVTSNVVPVTVR